MTNKNYLTTEKIKQITESSFTPLRCKAHFTDWDKNLQFKVLDKHNNKIVETNEIDVNSIDKKDLEAIIYPYREKVKSKGFNLDQ